MQWTLWTVRKEESEEVVTVSAGSRGKRPQEIWESNSCSEEEQKRLWSEGKKRGNISPGHTVYDEKENAIK